MRATDPDNNGIYTFKRENSFPEGWTPSGSWNLYGSDVQEARSTDPLELKTKLTEGQYSFFYASIHENKLYCIYMLLNDYGSATASLAFSKTGITRKNIQISPQGILKNWVVQYSKPYETRETDDVMCGTSLGPLAKVTDCPFTE